MIRNEYVNKKELLEALDKYESELRGGFYDYFDKDGIVEMINGLSVIRVDEDN